MQNVLANCEKSLNRLDSRVRLIPCPELNAGIMAMLEEYAQQAERYRTLAEQAQDAAERGYALRLHRNAIAAMALQEHWLRVRALGVQSPASIRD